MSQDNVEIVRLMWQAFLGEDPLSALSFCDPDIEWDGTNLPDGKVARGFEAIVEHNMRWAEMWDDWTMEPEQFIDAGDDHVILVFRETGRSESGLHMHGRHAELYTVRNGKVAHRKGFSDPDEAFEAAGLPERNASRSEPRGPMSNENAEVVRRQFDAFERGGLDAVVEFWHPDIEWRAVEGAADDIGVLRGPDALRRYYEDWIETFDQLRAEVEEVIFEADERVAVGVHNSGRGRASGVPTEGRYYVVCTVRDGLILSGREYASPEQALHAVRELSES